MKNYLKYALLSLITLGFTACDKDDKETTHSMTLDTYVVTANVEGVTKSIAITADDAWTAVAADEWVKVSPENGDKNTSATLTVARNADEESRRSTVTFLIENVIVAQITVSQTGYGPSLALAFDKTDFDDKGGTVTFQIATNGDEWDYTVTNGAWLEETEKTASTLKFMVPVNEGTERIASLLFKLTDYPTKTWQVSIIQAANSTVPTFITHETPTSDVIDLGAAEETLFAWTGTNIVGGYVFEIAAAANMNDPLLSVETNDETLTFPSIDFDRQLYKAGLPSGASHTLYWRVKPKSENVLLTKPLTVSALNLKRPTVKSDALHGDLLDAVFNPDTTATDASGYGNQILSYFRDNNLKVVYNNTYKRYEVIFNPKGGQNATGNATQGDWYRVNYMSDQTFKDRLSDGHTFECLVRFDWNYVANSVTYETKWFASHEAGGTGFLISTAAHASGANGITWLPNTTTGDGGSNTYRWANSQVKPDGKTYYHLVGVWDNVGGKAIIYVDGVKKSEVVASGTLRLASSTSQWIGIGGDPSGDNCSNQFIGSIVIARVYDAALTETQVTTLWNQVKP